jgi:hypothetical protein
VRRAACILVVLVFSLVSCSGGDDQSQAPQEGTGAGGGTVAPPEVTEGTPRTAALASVPEADEIAREWEGDAELYAVASIAPRVDAEGRAPGWLYTYVSPSAGAVASVSLAGAEAEITPPQELPEVQIQDITDNVLPPPDRLIDSSQAIAEAPQVLEVVEGSPGAQVSAGLDSFSSEDAVWILSTTAGEERVEQKVPALK